MPPFERPRALKARDIYHPPVSLNLPVIGLVIAFAMLLLICLGICCCSYRKTTKRNERYQQQRSRAGCERIGFTRLEFPSMNDPSTETGLVVRLKASEWPTISSPPAYSTIDPVVLVSPQNPQPESERLLPPTPLTPRAPSPPPPTYSTTR